MNNSNKANDKPAPCEHDYKLIEVRSRDIGSGTLGYARERIARFYCAKCLKFEEKKI